MTNMVKLIKLSKRYKIPIVEDACQSILGSINNKNAGAWGEFGAFSLHPLKNINVWSDGGVITTNNKKKYEKLLLLRNHGLVDRDTVKIYTWVPPNGGIGNWDMQTITVSGWNGDNRLEHLSFNHDGTRLFVGEGVYAGNNKGRGYIFSFTNGSNKYQGTWSTLSTESLGTTTNVPTNNDDQQGFLRFIRSFFVSTNIINGINLSELINNLDENLKSWELKDLEDEKEEKKEKEEEERKKEEDEEKEKEEKEKD